MNNPSEAYKLNSLITEEESKIEKLYTELGKMYFHSHIDCYEETFATLMSEISLSFENIQKYEEQIVVANGNVICPECKTVSPAGTQFCTSCGKSFSESPQPKQNACPKCGALLVPGSQFCTGCGKKISPADKTTTVASVVSICHKCGKTLPYGTKFCTFCGAVISSDPSSPSAAMASVVHTCSKCGIPLDYGTKFCTSCGAKVEDPDTTPVSPIPVSNANPSILFCQKCGESLEPGSKFCTSCGTKQD
ncbi:MAG: zinc ribbon domain-containing protein [Oscillospiraceae bacterium]|nr:zinc ribbon domain-containing protein [Oscillospiraceae bacterium]